MVGDAAALLLTAQRGLAFTGAGISAESGIPTFRGEGGLWTKFDPVKVASLDYFMADPSAYWKVSKERGSIALAARPNPGHHALAALEAAGHLGAIATQNTDGPHQDSGRRPGLPPRFYSSRRCGPRSRRCTRQRRAPARCRDRCRRYRR